MKSFWTRTSGDVHVISSVHASATVERDSGGWAVTITDPDGKELFVRSFGSLRAARRWAESML